MQKNLRDVGETLEPILAQTVFALAQKAGDVIHELRIRAGLPLSAVSRGENLYVTAAGELTQKPERAMTVTPMQVEESFFRMCKNSVYAYAPEIAEGFITLPGGHRAGLAGRVVTEEGKATGLRDVSSIAVRLAGEVPGCADELLPFFIKEGKILSGLIVSPPGGGKTTLLRDLARSISCRGKRVCVIDERGEIAGCSKGVAQNDLGPLCEVLDGCGKSDGILRALRCLSPQVIISDELGSVEESRAVLQGLHGGVPVILSLHAASRQEAALRAQTRMLLEEHAMDLMVVLDGADRPGTIKDIYYLRGEESKDAVQGNGNYSGGGCAGVMGLSQERRALDPNARD